MRRTLLMIAAVALLLTQCRKPAVELPTAGPANENMVSMTVTVGHGGKTDINGTTGAIKWSKNDKLYVGDGEKYIGFLTLVGNGGSATGTFTGTVSATESNDFGFYYLGSNPPEVSNSATSATVSFASQTGVLADASSCHIGYGTATGEVDGGSILIDGVVTMTSKVAIAYFEFKENGTSDYTGAITLSGTNICNEMTVKFSGAESGMFTGKEGTEGNAISLTNTSSSKKYVMLVPPANAVEETLNFGGGAEGSTKFYKGIEANKFYCLGEGYPIEVPVTPFVFTVAAGTKVKFSPGNLWADATGATPVFHFEANQWDFHVEELNDDGDGIWNQSHVSHFYWSKSADVAVAKDYEDDEASTEDSFFTNTDETTANPGFHVNGETVENQWRTLSSEEWDYLLGERDKASSLRAWVTLTDVSVSGLVILPDGSTVAASTVTTTALVASSGAVFLPAAGDRFGTDVNYVGSDGYYCSSAPHWDIEDYAFLMYFNSGDDVYTYGDYRDNGVAVRLVR